MFKLALKNILKNKKDSLIVITLISVITILYFLGNTIIGKADESVRKSYIESLTGEVIIQKKDTITRNLFGANAAVVDEYFDIPVLPSYNSVIDILKQEDQIESFSPLITGSAYMDFLNVRHPVLLNGIDAHNYFNLFPGIILKEGRYLQPGEFGIMLTNDLVNYIHSETGHKPEIGTPLLFTTGAETGFFRIRELPLIGIFQYENPGHFMSDIVLLDSQTVRDLNSVRVAEYIQNIELPDIDAFFTEDFNLDIEQDSDITQFTIDYLADILSDRDDTISSVHGDWYFILIRLKDRVSIDSFISSINRKLEPFDVMAVDWRVASGTSSILALLVQFLFNAGIILISITGVIAIINILLIYVFRRFKEIGTLRAIGARDSFIRTLIYSENIIYSCASGIIGIIAGLFILSWINSLNITIDNDILITLFGGNILHFNFFPSVAFSSILLAVFLGIISSIYPVEIAVKIKPIVAVQRG